MKCKGKAIKRNKKGGHDLGCDRDKPATHLLIKTAGTPVLPFCDPCAESFINAQNGVRGTARVKLKKPKSLTPEVERHILEAQVLPITPELLEEHKEHL